MAQSIQELDHRVNAVRRLCEDVYESYNTPEYISPDPLELVLEYPDPADRELAALICSSLALGRVELILEACRSVLSRFARLREELEEASFAELQERFSGFVYRFFKRDEIASFLFALGETLRREGSLERCFREGMRNGGVDGTLVPALSRFRDTLIERCPRDPGILLPDPSKGGATKRLHLFLRWQVRRDAVDPGGWSGVDARRLVVPMDTHMYRMASLFGSTTRKSVDLKTALEVTAFFRRFAPEDPVRYDFSLTRFGIHPLLRGEYPRVAKAVEIW